MEIRVTNLWPNRLIGDENIKDESERSTFATYKFYQADSPLLDSGLFDPVMVATVIEK